MGALGHLQGGHKNGCQPARAVAKAARVLSFGLDHPFARNSNNWSLILKKTYNLPVFDCTYA